MNLVVYAMHDRYTGFMQPTFELNDAVALRNFEHAILNTDSLLNSHSSDYRLMKIGRYNSENGLLEAICPPEVVAEGHAVFLKSVMQDFEGEKGGAKN